MRKLYFNSEIYYFDLLGSLIDKETLVSKNICGKTEYSVLECWQLKNKKFLITELHGNHNDDNFNYLYLDRKIIENNLSISDLKKYKKFYKNWRGKNESKKI